MDVDYSPTGREVVAGSYDRSVRIFAYNGGRSREVYHTKRMQRCVARGGCRVDVNGLTLELPTVSLRCASAATASTCSAAART